MSRSACSIWKWIVLLAYGFIVSGLPVPCGYLAPAATQSVLNERLAAKDRSSPFPCMDKTCGCLSSDQCFQHCCCHTPTELLMWAQSQQIELTIIESLQARVETLRQTTEKKYLYVVNTPATNRVVVKRVKKTTAKAPWKTQKYVATISQWLLRVR